ncbi:nickel pincer cofactor biosynthesis protein LarB [soil metagenome]
MDDAGIRELLDAVARGGLDPEEAVAQLRRLPFADLGFARVDHHRPLRQGMAEAVYGPGKTAEQCAAIVTELLAGPAGPAPEAPRGSDSPAGPAPEAPRGSEGRDAGPVLLTRAGDDQVAAALAANPAGTRHGTTVVWRPGSERSERVLIVTAGTADLPVAEECAATLNAHGFRPDRLADVGVAGLHRLLEAADRVVDADAVVVVAGMEGALASVIGGLTASPVVAVPTSVGYGAGLEGVTALLGMLASCAAGLTVVGIDNGFGAACAVVRLFGPHRRTGESTGAVGNGSAPTEAGRPVAARADAARTDVHR